MSLFKTKEFWRTQCNSKHTFTNLSLCSFELKVSSENKLNCIAIGSLEGYIWVFSPHIRDEGFFPDDQLLEANLQSPILQVASGNFYPNESYPTLAILHPCSLSLYLVVPQYDRESLSPLQHHYVLFELFKKKLVLPAFSLAQGYLLPSEILEILCVQYQDSSIAFFKGDQLIFFSCFNNPHLPCPLICINCNRSIVRGNDQTVEGYSFYKLGQYSSMEIIPKSSRTQKLPPDWSCILGDSVVDISITQRPGAPTIIFVLGEMSIFGFSECGKMFFTKHLDCEAMTLTSYMFRMPVQEDTSQFSECPKDETKEFPCGEGSSTRNPSFETMSNFKSLYFVITRNKHLLLHHGTRLIWAAKLPFAPIAASRIQIETVKGVIVALSECGEVICAFLGTAPEIPRSSSVSPYRRIDHGKISEEIKVLKTNINNLKHCVFVGEKDKPVLKLQTDLKKIAYSAIAPYKSATPLQVPFAIYTLSLQSDLYLSNIRIRISARSPLVVSRDFYQLDAFFGKWSTEIKVGLAAEEAVASLEMKIHVLYEVAQGKIRYTGKTILLPLHLVYRFDQSTTSADSNHKLSISIKTSELKLANLYPEANTPNEETKCSLVAMQGSELTTLQVASNKNDEPSRLDLVSDSLPQLLIVWMNLEARLKRLRIPWEFQGNLPWEGFHESIKIYESLLTEKEHESGELYRATQEYRFVQKVLLLRYKEKHPGNLMGLDRILENSHRRLRNVAASSHKASERLRKSSRDLEAALRLTLSLMSHRCCLEYQEFQILKSVLLCPVDADGVSPLREAGERNMTHLLAGRKPCSHYTDLFQQLLQFLSDNSSRPLAFTSPGLV